MLKKMKNFFTLLKQAITEDRDQTRCYACRIVEIEQDKHENYIASIQLTNKSQIIKMKPEEVLADDELTNCFSPIDVRALTYLGYLGMNSPKYKILAQRLSETDNRFVFAIKQKGSNKPITKTADEISSDAELLASLDQKDAHMVGYTTASERACIEKEQMKKLLQK